MNNPVCLMCLKPSPLILCADCSTPAALPPRPVGDSPTNKATRRLKAEVYLAYGGLCACCGEDETAFLTIDHVENDGAVDRRSRGHSGRFYAWLKKQGFPRDRFQLLCRNCNWGRHVSPGHVCPHRSKALAAARRVTRKKTG